MFNRITASSNLPVVSSKWIDLLIEFLAKDFDEKFKPNEVYIFRKCVVCRTGYWAILTVLAKVREGAVPRGTQLVTIYLTYDLFVVGARCTNYLTWSSLRKTKRLLEGETGKGWEKGLQGVQRAGEKGTSRACETCYEGVSPTSVGEGYPPRRKKPMEGCNVAKVCLETFAPLNPSYLLRHFLRHMVHFHVHDILHFLLFLLPLTPHSSNIVPIRIFS